MKKLLLALTAVLALNSCERDPLVVIINDGEVTEVTAGQSEIGFKVVPGTLSGKGEYSFPTFDRPSRKGGFTSNNMSGKSDSGFDLNFFEGPSILNLYGDENYAPEIDFSDLPSQSIVVENGVYTYASTVGNQGLLQSNYLPFTLNTDATLVVDGDDDYTLKAVTDYSIVTIAENTDSGNASITITIGEYELNDRTDILFDTEWNSLDVKAGYVKSGNEMTIEIPYTIEMEGKVTVTGIASDTVDVETYKHYHYSVGFDVKLEGGVIIVAVEFSDFVLADEIVITEEVVLVDVGAKLANDTNLSLGLDVNTLSIPSFDIVIDGNNDVAITSSVDIYIAPADDVETVSHSFYSGNPAWFANVPKTFSQGLIGVDVSSWAAGDYIAVFRIEANGEVVFITSPVKVTL